MERSGIVFHFENHVYIGKKSYVCTKICGNFIALKLIQHVNFYTGSYYVCYVCFGSFSCIIFGSFSCIFFSSFLLGCLGLLGVPRGILKVYSGYTWGSPGLLGVYSGYTHGIHGYTRVHLGILRYTGGILG